MTRTALLVGVTLPLLGSLACASESSAAPTASPDPTPVVMRDTTTIQAGTYLSWDVSDFSECRYHFKVRQTGSFGAVDIEFQGRRYKEKDGVFYGDTFTLDNGYSLSTAKVVDVKLQCDS